MEKDILNGRIGCGDKFQLLFLGAGPAMRFKGPYAKSEYKILLYMPIKKYQ